MDKYLLEDLSFDSSLKKSSEVLLSCHNDKEVSIRELQLQEKMEELRKFRNYDDKIIDEIKRRRKGNRFREIIEFDEGNPVHRSLTKYNRQENLSVERIYRTNSPFKSRISSKPPLPIHNISRVRPKSVFNFGSNCVYMTEKVENFKWNDITNKQLADKVRMSIQEVDQVLKLKDDLKIQRSVSTNVRTENYVNIFKKDQEVYSHLNPKGSFHKFRELLKSNNLVVDDNVNLNTPQTKEREFKQELLTGSKMSTKTNWDTDIKEDILKPKFEISPNLRYRESEENNGHFSPDNKIIITDELKFSNYDSTIEVEQKEDFIQEGSLNEESQRESRTDSCKWEILKEDSLSECHEADRFPLTKSAPAQTDLVLFSIKISEDQLRNEEDIKNPIKEEKLYVSNKLDFIAAQLPLYSISEDVNSPYFASSPSNITTYMNGQTISNKAKSDINFEQKFSSPTELNDESNSAEKNERGVTVQTTTSISENYIENANLDTLEMKLEKVMKKRSKRIAIFESYLNEWEKQKFHKGKENKSIKRDSTPPMKGKKIPHKQRKSNHKSRVRNGGLKSAKTVKIQQKNTPSLYWSQGSTKSGVKNFNILSPVLKSVNNGIKHK